MSDLPRLVQSVHGYNIVKFIGQFFALPQKLGAIDLIEQDATILPGVFVGRHLSHVLRQVELAEVAEGATLRLRPLLRIAVSDGFWGADHPAYRPWFSHVYEGCEIILEAQTPGLDNQSLGAFDETLMAFRRYGDMGVKAECVENFIVTRDLQSQFVVANTPGIHFFQGAPLTLGAWPWVVQVETPQSLFLPFVTAADSASFSRDNPYFPLIKAMLLSAGCLGVITNIYKTAQLLPVLFESPELADKIFYCPFSIAPQAIAPKTGKRFLFTTSWHQHEASFYSRGGLEAVAAFLELSGRYPDLHLTVRCRLPDDLDPALRSAIDLADNIEVVADKISDQALDAILAETDYYLLPATSLHTVSTLRAMSHGCVCVLADSWGSDEFLLHGQNGIRVAGREGASWWHNPDEGWIAESYAGLRDRNTALTEALIDAIDPLLRQPELARRLSENARHYTSTVASFEAGRERFGAFLDNLRTQAARALQVEPLNGTNCHPPRPRSDLAKRS